MRVEEKEIADIIAGLAVFPVSSVTGVNQVEDLIFDLFVEVGVGEGGEITQIGEGKVEFFADFASEGVFGGLLEVDETAGQIEFALVGRPGADGEEDL